MSHHKDYSVEDWSYDDSDYRGGGGKGEGVNQQVE